MINMPELANTRMQCPKCPNKFSRISVLLIIVLYLFLSETATGETSPNVPLNHEAYRYIEKLVGFGLIESSMSGTKPFTRNEMARLLVEAIDNRERNPASNLEVADILLERLKRDFHEELVRWGRVEGKEVRTFFKPLDYAIFSYIYSDGNLSDLTYKRRRGAIEATEGTPLVFNNEGITYDEGHNGTLEIFSRAELFGLFSLAYRPLIEWGDIAEESDLNFSTINGYLVFSPSKYLNLEIGRDSLWWGQGAHGTLILTNNAPPLDMVKLSNSEPLLLPGILRHVGPLKYTFFIAQLEENRHIPEPYFSGLRINFKPTPNFELGLSRTFMFEGEGQSLGAGRFFELLIGKDISQTPDESNQMAVIDGRLRLPMLRNTDIYFECGGEHGKDFLPSRHAFLLGAYIPRLTTDGRSDLRVEIATTDNTSRIGPYWYNHGTYRSGYTHKEMIMGHHIGGEALDIFGRLTRYIGKNAFVGFDIDYRKQRLAAEDGEKHLQMGVDFTYEINACTSVSMRYGFENVEDVASNDEKDKHLALIQLQTRF